jgi:exodeoxyribonuclease VII small subunit
MKEDNLNYTLAINELEQIVSEIENATLSVDDLSMKVKRAAELLQYCKNKLSSTEQEVNNVLKGFDKDQATQEQ